MLYRQKYKKYLKFFVATICLLSIYYFIISGNVNLEYKPDFDYICPDNASSLSSKHVCFKESHVFFVETSGTNILNVRQACAVESTARHNPLMEIYVLMTPSMLIAQNHTLIRKLVTLQNIHFIRIDIDALVYGSPIFKWYRQEKWKKSKYKVIHLSDALRFVLMWKFGGIYLDMDVVTLRSLEHLKNAAITENWDRIANGILIFDKNHELFRRCMHDFANNYDPYNFLNNGLGTFTNNIKKYCEVKDTGKISGADCGINILPPDAAFPIPWENWEDFFAPSDSRNISAVYNSSYMIHVWNKLSYKLKLKLGINSVYELAIKQHCPFSYEYAQEIGYI